MKYDMSLTDQDIVDETYKQYLGGGAGDWLGRGRAQLEFFKSQGLTPDSRFLDIGCGPLRAGVHFIPWLETGKYTGFDANASFIEVARRIVEKEGFAAKQPDIRLITDFHLGDYERSDFALAFSVLNHCTPAQKAQFFSQCSQYLSAGGRLFVTHAKWFRSGFEIPANVRLVRTFVQGDSDIFDEAWGGAPGVFPILEFQCP